METTITDTIKTTTTIKEITTIIEKILGNQVLT